MLELIKRMDGNTSVDIYDTLTLPYELRIRGRLKAVSDNDRDVGLFLDRGPVLRHGDLLQANSGEVIQVLAADEPVATAYIESGLPLARLCYHLGNRHVSLALGSDEDGRHWVRFPPDHVLEELAVLLGADLTHHEAPFDPESGAYAQAGREHSHSNGHAHSHHHDHDHDHSHSVTQHHNHSQHDGHNHAP
ncbi:urease accessory protein UreE [Psychrobacter sp. ANT_WB68]|uniref:urease accessory protein UreE n=1 Tax=Psychrobacter sp. ANT_WB68 TaxID=2597355 RepID=UPI0011F31B3E|nr:urease accessory protein UreE [Psychrobacter sp. ANT_WB68]KAA0915555.1 urease accessory protein UreE [Psychrobacter sp. ANT_WB68]